jgi:hypothetical protein
MFGRQTTDAGCQYPRRVGPRRNGVRGRRLLGRRDPEARRGGPPRNIFRGGGRDGGFRDMMKGNLLFSLHDFENRKKIFPAVNRRMKFTLPPDRHRKRRAGYRGRRSFVLQSECSRPGRPRASVSAVRGRNQDAQPEHTEPPDFPERERRRPHKSGIPTCSHSLARENSRLDAG